MDGGPYHAGACVRRAGNGETGERKAGGVESRLKGPEHLALTTQVGCRTMWGLQGNGTMRGMLMSRPGAGRTRGAWHGEVRVRCCVLDGRGLGAIRGLALHQKELGNLGGEGPAAEGVAYAVVSSSSATLVITGAQVQVYRRAVDAKGSGEKVIKYGTNSITRKFLIASSPLFPVVRRRCTGGRWTWRGRPSQGRPPHGAATTAAPPVPASARVQAPLTRSWTRQRLLLRRCG